MPYIVQRLGRAAFVLWAAYTFGFLILYLLPSDAAEIMAAGAEGAEIAPEKLAQFRAEMGLDRPLIVQYLDALAGLFRGSMGTSISTGRPVLSMLAEALGPTLVFASVTIVVATLAAIVFTFVATGTRRQRLREVLLSLPGIGLSFPTFCIGILLLQVFSFRLGWFPAFGGNGPLSLVLPVATLSVPAAALIAQLLTKGIDDEWGQLYVSQLHAKGLTPSRIFIRHLLRNACLPALTAAALLVGELFAGSIIVETVFSRPGLGRVIIAAVTARDLPVVLGVVLCGAVIFVVVNAIVDLLYPILDPRILRLRQRGASA